MSERRTPALVTRASGLLIGAQLGQLVEGVQQYTLLVGGRVIILLGCWGRITSIRLSCNRLVVFAIGFNRNVSR